MTTESPFHLHYFESFNPTNRKILIIPDLLQFSHVHQDCIEDLRHHASIYWLDFQVKNTNDIVHWSFSVESIKESFNTLLAEHSHFTLCVAQGLGTTLVPSSNTFEQIVLCNPSMKDGSITALKALSGLGKIITPTTRGLVQSIVEGHWRDQYGLADFETPHPWYGSTPPEHTMLSNSTWYSVLSLIQHSTLGQDWWPNGLLFGGKAPNTIQTLSMLPSNREIQYKVYPNLHTNLLLACKVRQDIKKHYLEKS